MAGPGRTDEVLTDRVSLPRPPQGPPQSRNPLEWLKWANATLITFLANLVRFLEDDISKVHRNLNELTGKGPNITDVAGVLTLSARIHCVTGSSSISRIEASPGFHGQVWLVSLGGGWELVVAPGGNIAVSAHPADGEALTVVYDVHTGIWHPSGAATLPPGETFPLRLSEDVECIGDFVETATLIPAGVPAFMIRTEVLEEVDVDHFLVGIESVPAAWGRSEPTVGAENDMATMEGGAPTFPTAFLPVRLTFPTTASAGSVRVHLWYANYSL